MALFGIGLISLSGSLRVELGDALSLLFALVYSFLIVATGICAEEGEPSGNVLLSISDGQEDFPLSQC